MSTLTYRDCYAACRANGGTIQACEESCASQMPGDTCDPCCGLWSCFTGDVAQTVQSATGAIYSYGTEALGTVRSTTYGIAAAAVALVILLVVLRR